MMKRILVSAIACLAFCFATLTSASSAHAGTVMPSSGLLLNLSPLYVTSYLASSAPPTQPDVLSQLKATVMPQLAEILTPEQLAMLETNISNGGSFRKTFKTLMLTPAQKSEIKTLLSSVAQKGALASLTPDQKKELFMKKKEAFMPSSEEIIDKINASKAGEGGTVSQAVQDKIEKGLKARDSFMPSSKTIMEKIESSVESVKEGIEAPWVINQSN